MVTTALFWIFGLPLGWLASASSLFVVIALSNRWVVGQPWPGRLREDLIRCGFCAGELFLGFFVTWACCALFWGNPFPAAGLPYVPSVILMWGTILYFWYDEVDEFDMYRPLCGPGILLFTPLIAGLLAMFVGGVLAELLIGLFADQSIVS